MGEPAGIGPELALSAWLKRRSADLPVFVFIGFADYLRQLAAKLDLDVPITTVNEPGQAAPAFADALPVMALEQTTPVVPGKPDPVSAPAVLEAIEQAVIFAGKGQVAALVTNPIHKHTLAQAGFPHPGHTEFLGALSGKSPPLGPVMLLASPKLNVVPVTVHLALADVADALSVPKIVSAGNITAAALKRYFGVENPRLAVAGLNPHAGEGGLFGAQEKEIIQPAIDALNASGIKTFGPLAADTLFHDEARAGYDAALCMYHDQALIPVKTLGFHDAVNVTLGLEFIRTSPDHGTGLDIAGKGQANPASLIASLRLAHRMANMAEQLDAT